MGAEAAVRAGDHGVGVAQPHGKGCDQRRLERTRLRAVGSGRRAAP
jgi:hypothetical protein